MPNDPQDPRLHTQRSSEGLKSMGLCPERSVDRQHFSTAGKKELSNPSLPHHEEETQVQKRESVCPKSHSAKGDQQATRLPGRSPSTTLCRLLPFLSCDRLQNLISPILCRAAAVTPHWRWGHEGRQLEAERKWQKPSSGYREKAVTL